MQIRIHILRLGSALYSTLNNEIERLTKIRACSSCLYIIEDPQDLDHRAEQSYTKRGWTSFKLQTSETWNTRISTYQCHIVRDAKTTTLSLQCLWAFTPKNLDPKMNSAKRGSILEDDNRNDEGRVEDTVDASEEKRLKVTSMLYYQYFS